MKRPEEETILWRRLDQPGHESARLFLQGPHWHLVGTSVFVHKSAPCRLDYLIVCNSNWQTFFSRISGWVGDETVEIEVSVDSVHRWQLNGVESPAVIGCIDLDLNFSPSTNLLPLRRLDLKIGQEAVVRAAWLRFPGFTLEPLEQLYRRTNQNSYRYESGGGRFFADLEVNDAGFVTHYPSFFQEEE
ncbi:MAG: putative glycolipid-binding domain-containing protein [Blastocatellia bacterium]|nr:putative glycolipid-binding domain-containing protein [Blastocatellia bacterium]